MSFLFRSKKERERDARKARRKAFRQAERALDELKDRMKRLQRDADKAWEAARAAAANGEEAAVNRNLTAYRGKQVLLTQLQRKQWVFEQTLTKLEVSGTDAEFSQALELLNQTLSVDPERLAEGMENTGELLDEQKDAERMWERLYEKELEGAEGELTERVPEMGELKNRLFSEAVEKPEEDLAQRLSEGQERAQRLLRKDAEKSD